MTWKNAYTKALESRAEYLQSTGQGELATAIKDKAFAYSPKCQSPIPSAETPWEWPRPKFDFNAEELFQRLERSKSLIPLAQAEEYREWIQNLEAESDFENALELREEILDRIWRSWKATKSGKELVSRPQFESAQGPYNNRTVLEDLLENVASVDPIWVADFTELYQRMHIWDKILKN